MSMVNFPIQNRFNLYQMPAIIWSILTIIISSKSNLSTPDLGFELQDKLLHFLYYTVYGIFLCYAFYNQKKFVFVKRNYIYSAIIFGSLFGLSDEFHQYFVENRTMDFWDWIADSLGVTFGVGLFIVKLIFQKKSDI
jgi:VanZ family protein